MINIKYFILNLLNFVKKAWKFLVWAKLNCFLLILLNLNDKKAKFGGKIQ